MIYVSEQLDQISTTFFKEPPGYNDYNIDTYSKKPIYNIHIPKNVKQK